MILDCLNYNLRDEVRLLMVDAMHRLIAADKNVDFLSVYRAVIEDIEMDMESAAIIYQNASVDIKTMYDGISDSLTSNDALDKYIHGDIERVLGEANSPANVVNKDVNWQKENSAKHIAKVLIKTIDNSLFPTTNKLTAARQVRDAIISYAKSVLKTQAKVGMTPEAMLSRAIENDLLDPSVDGKNFGSVGMDKLWDALKPAIETISDGITDPAIRVQFKNEIQKIKDAALNMGITETSRKKILYDLIAKHEDSSGNKPWAKTLGLKRLDQERRKRDRNRMDSEDTKKWYEEEKKKLKVVADIDNIIKQTDPVEILGDILDAELNRRGVTDARQRNKIYDAIIKDFTEVRSADVAASIFSLNIDKWKDLKKKLIDEVAISHGFFRLSGARKLVDYGNKNGLGWLQDALYESTEPSLRNRAPSINTKTSTADIKDLVGRLVDDWVQSKDYDQVNGAMKKIMEQNNKEVKDKVRDIDRILKMEQRGYGVDAITESMAASVLGLRLRPEYVAELSKIAKRYNELIKPPHELYDELATDPDLAPGWEETRKRLPQFHSMSMMARLSHEQINIDLSNLLSKAVRDDNWLSVNGVTQFMSKLGRISLTGILMNAYNATQNFFHAQYSMMTAIPKFGLKKFIKDEKDFGKIVYSIISGDPAGMSDEEIRRATDSNTIYHETTPIGKAIGAAKAFVEGFLTGIDAAGMVITQRNRMLAVINEEILAKGWDNAKAQEKMKEYEDLSSSVVALKLAEKYLAAAGISKDYKPKRYRRMLKREVMNIEIGFWMGANMNELMDPERVAGYYRMTAGTARQQFGKSDPVTKHREGSAIVPHAAGVPNIPYHMIKAMADAERSAQNRNIEGAKNDGWLAFISYAHGILARGIMPFASGAWRFFNFAFVGGLAPIATPITYAKMKRFRKEWETLVKTRDTEVAVNEADVLAARHNFETMRMYTKVGMSAMLTLAIYVTAAYAAADDDDDEETIINRVLRQSNEWSQNPFVKKMLTRVAPVFVRYIAGHAEGKYTKRRGPKDPKKTPVALGLGYAASTRTPTSTVDIYEMFYKDGLATIGKMHGTAFTGFGGLSWPVNMFYNQFYRELILGERVSFDQKDNPILRGITENEILNGWMTGSATTGLTSALDKMAGRSGPLEYLPLVGDSYETWKDIPYEQLVQDFKGKNIKDIPWSTYGLEDIYKKRDDIQKAYNSLDALKAKIIAIADTWGIEEMDSENDLRQWWENPNLPFTVPAPEGVSPEALKSNFGITINESGTVNILAAAANKIGLKDLDIQDFTNALKFKILQERL